jgi:hypothetical protein
MCFIQMITPAIFLCFVTLCFVLTIPYIKLSCFLYTHVFCKHVIHSYVFSTPLIYKSITGRDPIALSKALLGALATTNATLDTDMPAPHANDPAHSPAPRLYPDRSFSHPRQIAMPPPTSQPIVQRHLPQPHTLRCCHPPLWVPLSPSFGCCSRISQRPRVHVMHKRCAPVCLGRLHF